MNSYNFDNMRSFYDIEVPSVIERIIMSKKAELLLSPFLDKEETRKIIEHLPYIKTVSQLQNLIIKKIIDGILKKTKSEIFCENIENLDARKSYLFISNHKDIILDPAFLNYILMKYGHNTAEIAIGNNLLIEPWIEDIVRVNKCFIIFRNLQGRELLMSSKKVSAYIMYLIQEKNSSLWIAQREGRTKDGNDETQASLLKMLYLSAKNTSPTETIRMLNILPVAISFEYDPCDVLKAKELYLQEQGEEYVKSAEDDILSMKFSLTGLKGKVCYVFTQLIEENLIPHNVDQQTATEIIAKKIDEKIYSAYKLFPSHYYSYDKFFNTNKFKNLYTEENIMEFENIIDEKIQLLLPHFFQNKDFRKHVYRQYANTVKNSLSVNNIP